MNELHAWKVTRERATELQELLRDRIELIWDGREITTIAGVDVSYEANRAYAAIAILRYADLKPLHAVCAATHCEFPYVPGLLAFREGPAVLAAWQEAEFQPDLVLFDAHGFAHPRGLGLASHMGLWLDTPTVGVAKSRLYGWHEEPGPERGNVVSLHDERDPTIVIGAVMRTQSMEKPLYVSPGHLVDAPVAIQVVRRCCTNSRIPEPIKWSHRIARARDAKMTEWRDALKQG